MGRDKVIEAQKLGGVSLKLSRILAQGLKGYRALIARAELVLARFPAAQKVRLG